MYVGTTPQIKINSNIPISNIKRLWITFESQKVELTKELSDCDIIENQIHCTLSQEDTFLLNPDNKDIKIKDMEPIRYEKYDYVLIVCKNELDYQSLTRLLKLDDKKVIVSKGKTGTRKIKARAIWYDDVDFVLKKK